MEVYDSIEDRVSVNSTIEKKILLQILSVSLAGIILYIINGIFVVMSMDIIRESCIALVFYGALSFWVYRSGQFLLKKRVVSFIMLNSVVLGFFVLGGLKGIAAFDLLNMFLYISVIFQGKERTYYLIALSAILSALFFVQLNVPQIILNRSANDPEWLFYMNVILRVVLAYNIGMALRVGYSKEHDRSQKLLKEIHDLNADITSHNEELKSMQEELRANNDKLEILVQERTKKLELQNETLVMYAYMNSHVFRGPICRIQGILNLLEIEKEEAVRDELQGYLLQEVREIDKVVKDISVLLYESDAEFIEEIRLKAKKLYNV